MFRLHKEFVKFQRVFSEIVSTGHAVNLEFCQDREEESGEILCDHGLP